MLLISAVTALHFGPGNRFCFRYKQENPFENVTANILWSVRKTQPCVKFEFNIRAHMRKVNDILWTKLKSCKTWEKFSSGARSPTMSEIIVNLAKFSTIIDQILCLQFLRR